LVTAEASLILACLRYILNKHDALAVAEILLLANKHNIEDVIADRLEHLEKMKLDAEDAERWGHDNEYIKHLRSIRHKSKELSATEILNGVIEKLDIRRTVAAWSNEQQRLDNIDALRKLALDYEDTCNRLHSAATLGGFLLWLDDLGNDDRDEQGKGAGVNAVNVMTYHKSKGLEWPFVVCHGLGNELRENIWGVRIVRQKPEIDINYPLANRLLCYWVNPYSDQVKGTELMETVETHSAKKISKKEALAEEARLLYVGLTRARDYLVFPTMPKKATKWLNRVFHKGEEQTPSLDTHGTAMLWMWNDDEIPVKTQLFNYEKNMASLEQVEHAIDYLEPHVGEQDHDSAIVDSAQSLFPNLDFKFGNSQVFCKAFVMPSDDALSYDVLQPIFNTFIQADNPTGFSLEIRQKMAKNLLQQHELLDWVRPEDLLYFSTCFYKNINKTFKIESIEKYRSFLYNMTGERCFKGIVDLVIKTEDNQLVLAKYLTQESTKLNGHKNKLKEDVFLLEAAGKVLKSENEASEIKLYIIQSIEGTWTPVVMKREAKQSSLFG